MPQYTSVYLSIPLSIPCMMPDASVYLSIPQYTSQYTLHDARAISQDFRNCPSSLLYKMAQTPNETTSAQKLDKMTKYNIFNELKKNLDRNTKLALSDKKIKANLAKLRDHFAATGGDGVSGGGQKMAEIMADLHPTVQGVYQLMQDQTKTIVAAIDTRADAIDRRLDTQTVTLAKIAVCVDRQTRVLMGTNYDEDAMTTLTNRELLAQNCQAVRALQSQNINLRAEMKACPGASLIEQRTKRLEANEAAEEADSITKKLATEAQKKRKQHVDDAKNARKDIAATWKEKEEAEKAAKAAKASEKTAKA